MSVKDRFGEGVDIFPAGRPCVADTGDARIEGAASRSRMALNRVGKHPVAVPARTGGQRGADGYRRGRGDRVKFGLQHGEVNVGRCDGRDNIRIRSCCNSQPLGRRVGPGTVDKLHIILLFVGRSSYRIEGRATQRGDSAHARDHFPGYNGWRSGGCLRRRGHFRLLSQAHTERKSQPDKDVRDFWGGAQ